MIGVRRHQIQKLVVVEVGERHPAVRVTPDPDQPRVGERAVSHPCEHSDRFRRSVIHEEIGVAVAIDVVEPHRVGMRGHAHVKLRVAAARETSTGHRKQDGHIGVCMICDNEVFEPIPVEIGSR